MDHLLLTLMTYALHEEAQIQQAFFMRHVADVSYISSIRYLYGTCYPFSIKLSAGPSDKYFGNHRKEKGLFQHLKTISIS